MRSPVADEGFGIEVSRMRNRAVKIWRALLFSVQVEAL